MRSIKSLIRSLGLAAAVSGAVASMPAIASAGELRVGVSIGAFTGALSPYGEWIQVAGIGAAWRPYAEVVGADFVPYGTGGHWVYSDYGWTFESDYTWGWAPFHYGRWAQDPTYGWVWVPGTEWGPAWVEWRFGGGVVGWAPLAPQYFVAREPQFVFVAQADFVDRDVCAHRLPYARARAVYGATVRVDDRVSYGGRTFWSGPDPAHFRELAQRPIPRERVIAPSPGRIEAARFERERAARREEARAQYARERAAEEREQYARDEEARARYARERAADQREQQAREEEARARYERERAAQQREQSAREEEARARVARERASEQRAQDARMEEARAQQARERAAQQREQDARMEQARAQQARDRAYRTQPQPSSQPSWQQSRERVFTQREPARPQLATPRMQPISPRPERAQPVMQRNARPERAQQAPAANRDQSRNAHNRRG